MKAVFAIQVKTGAELQAKEMLKHVILTKGETEIKSIYSLDTYTEVINDITSGMTDLRVTEEDISTHLNSARYRSAINNKRTQLESLDRYNAPEYMEVKKQYRKEMNELQKQMMGIKGNAKKLHNVMTGYILVELNQASDYLPNETYHLINDIPLVQRVLSQEPIPNYEMEEFISNLGQMTEPEVSLNVQEEVNHQQVDEKIKELLIQANEKDVTKTEQLSLFEEMDDLRVNASAVERTTKMIENKPLHHVLKRIKAFIKSKQEVVTMPVSILYELYNDNEIDNIRNVMNKKDFLYRIESIVEQKDVLAL